MIHTRRLKIYSGLTIFILSALACSFTAQPAQDPGLEQTRIALGVEQTTVAREKATLAALDAAPAVEAATLPPTAAPPPATQTSLPPTPSSEPSVIPPAASETPVPSPTALDLEARIKAANVLVYEDMVGYYDRSPLVRQAVNEMGFSGGKVVEVGDALGKFKEQLLGSVQWDLILVAAEHRSAVQGEFWQYVYDQVTNRGAAAAIEVWYLDEHYTDIQPLFHQCGIEYQKDWTRGEKYNFLDYAIYPLQPDHPFFQPPQAPVSLANPNFLYWVPPTTSDAGDYIQLGSSGDAVMLMGTAPYAKSSNGVLATCLGGTLMVQTYSSHDYKPVEVVSMWKNYMRYTLTNHFLNQAQ